MLVPTTGPDSSDLYDIVDLLMKSKGLIPSYLARPVVDTKHHTNLTNLDCVGTMQARPWPGLPYLCTP